MNKVEKITPKHAADFLETLVAGDEVWQTADRRVILDIAALLRTYIGNNKAESLDDYQYELKAKVMCHTCKAWINVDDCQFLNIEEDIQGRDTMTFRCPDGHESKSLVVV